MISLYAVGRKITQFLNPRRARSDITFFEVKTLYNLAYEQKAQARNALRQSRRTVAKAQAMDEAYRAQLGLVRRAA